MNNSLLSFSHAINNHSQSLGFLNKHASEINNKLKIIEQKIKDIETIQNKLQSHILSSEGEKNQSSQTSSSISEDRIRIIVKEYVDIALKNMVEVKSTPINSSTNNVNFTEFNNDNNVFAQLEQAYNTNIIDDSDITIEEKKVKKPVGRKPTKK